MCIENKNAIGQETSTEKFRNVPASLRPKSLNEYQVVCHFHNRPIFIQEYSGRIKLTEIHKEYREWILYAEGYSTPNLDVKGRLNSFSGCILIRICDWVLAELTPSKITVYAETQRLALKHLNLLVSEFAFPENANPPPHFHLIISEPFTGSMSTIPVMIPNEPIMDETGMSLHYGEDFPAWHRQFVGKLTQQDRGITIFRGAPGIGKTSYLRKLMVALLKTHFFLFMPLRIGWIFNAPETIHFWVNQKEQNPGRKLVVILEDAEHFLMERGPDNATSVSDLLNAGDGLLGDFLQLHLICTLNCEIDRLDKAVTRPGRMLAYREFKRLTPDQAQKLAAAKKLQIKPQESYSLAEIYNGPNMLEAEISKRKVGFVT
jgi:hypothetical protein